MSQIDEDSACMLACHPKRVLLLNDVAVAELPPFSESSGPPQNASCICVISGQLVLQSKATLITKKLLSNKINRYKFDRRKNIHAIRAGACTQSTRGNV